MNRIIRALIILLLPLSSMGALTVNNGGGATNITSTSAWITATIVSTGAANPYLYSYWGTNSGGTNAASWEHTNSYGVSTQAAYSVQITGLSGSTIYYFRTHATNTYASTNSESAWASYSAQFITLTAPTSAPPSSVLTVTVDTNGVLKNPTNFFSANSSLMIADQQLTNAMFSARIGTNEAFATAQALTNTMFDAQIGSNTAAVGNLNNATNYINSAMATGTPLYVYSETDPVWSAVSNLYATGTPLYVESYLGTIIGASIAAGDADAVTTNAGMLAITWNTNAAGGGGTAVDYGVSDSTAYRGDWGAAVSNLVGECRTNAFQPFTATVTPDAGGTCTITYAHGSLVQIYQPAMDITLSFDDTDFPTNGVSRVGVEIYSLTNSVALDYATCTNEFASATNKSTTGWTTWFFRRVGEEIFKGRQ